WHELGVLRLQSLCLDDVKFGGNDNIHLHDPTCGAFLPVFKILASTVNMTVKFLTIRRSHGNYIVCNSSSVDNSFTTYFCSHLFPSLKVFALKDVNLENEAPLVISTKSYSFTLKCFEARTAVIKRKFCESVFQAQQEALTSQQLYFPDTSQPISSGLSSLPREVCKLVIFNVSSNLRTQRLLTSPVFMRFAHIVGRQSTISPGV
ncbi:uncharacterized protein M421DRAFT_396965, partial [Didymella exigua CBS 183.55]